MTNDPRLLELIAAAENLITNGGGIANRNRLKAALGAVPSDFTDMTFLRSLTPTPVVTAVLNRAVDLANASNDLHLRSHHLQFALEEIAPTTQPK
jgi:hypothetical protein